MPKKNKDVKNDNSKEEFDPLDELNTIDKFTSIVTEKDPLDMLAQQDADLIPDYDSESGSIVKTTNKEDAMDDSSTEVDESQDNDLIDTADKVDINNKDTADKTKETNKLSSSKKSKSLKKTETSKPEDVKKIDDVKVDEEGVPLLNQFDAETIKQIHLFDRLKLNKQRAIKFTMILVGVIIILLGSIQSFDEVVKVSDNVMYGEHQSFAIGLIILGMIIIVLAFYNEIIKYLGLNSMVSNENLKNNSKKNSTANKKKDD